MKLDRRSVAAAYIQGQGIEIGALHMPLKVPRSARVKYVDRFSVDDLRKHYPELKDKNLVNVDIIDDGERLDTIPASSLDFVIANHFIEHCQDPIGAVLGMFKVLQPGGILYLAIPDKRYSFDSQRPVTPLEHVMRDHLEGPEWSRRQHYEEWVRSVSKATDEEDVARQLSALMDMEYSIHYHAWTQAEMLELITALRRMVSFELEFSLRLDTEMIFILRRTGQELKVEVPQERVFSADEAAFAKDLDRALTPEPWCIDDVRFDGDTFEIDGWALAPEGRHDLLGFTLNDREFEEMVYPLPRTDIARVFWYKRGSQKSQFHCRTRVTREVAFKDGHATLKCINRETGAAIREQYNWYYPDDRHAPDLPNVEQRRRVSGNTNPAIFRLEGYTTFKKLDQALRSTANRSIGEFQNILDWGCGCGRLTRYFYLLPQAKITGTDVEKENLRWCREQLSYGRFLDAPLHPPTELEPDSFDLLIGISVFSHLNERDQVEWLQELRRVVKPGAMLLVSVLGDATAGRTFWSRKQWDDWQRKGFFSGDNDDLAGRLEEEHYYVNSYITSDYIRRNWSRFFECLEIIPAYIGNHQDLVIMRKPG